MSAKITFYHSYYHSMIRKTRKKKHIHTALPYTDHNRESPLYQSMNEI